MKNNLLKIKLLILIFIGSLFITSCKKIPYEERFTKITLGQTVNQVEKIMGEPEVIETYTSYLIYYWFEDISSSQKITSIEEAQRYTNKGIPVKYYCVCLYSADNSDYRIASASDIMSGIWGED